MGALISKQAQSERTLAPIGKGQFRCFKCRGVFPSKDGDWHHWNSMEVHLCRTCEKETRNSSERKTR